MPKPPNMNQMMRQVQQMQAEMAKAQEEIKQATVDASAGGGMVTVKISGELANCSSNWWISCTAVRKWI